MLFPARCKSKNNAGYPLVPADKQQRPAPTAFASQLILLLQIVPGVVDFLSVKEPILFMFLHLVLWATTVDFALLLLSFREV